MLHPKHNRIDYGAQLIPPEGYELNYAVGTTYSLDLETLMVLPVALFYSQLLDTTPDMLRYDMLDAITNAADKITVYYQKGKLIAPKQYHSLMAYWEKGIEAVKMDSHISSFHPKVWIIRFEAAEQPARYRLLVTSRNLTFARDWDIAFSTEGTVTSQDVDKNGPLVDFMHYLSSKGIRPLPDKFIKELGRVEFNHPTGFRLLNFFPIGISFPKGKTIYDNPLSGKSWDKLLVISPFVDDTVLKRLSKNTSAVILSRKEELDGLDKNTIKELGNDNFYQFSQFIQEAESLETISENSDYEPMDQNLHAKLFIGSKNGYHHWFLGSANSTLPAFGRNVEFMIELKTELHQQSPTKILSLLTKTGKGEIALFEPYDVKYRNDIASRHEQELDLRKIIYDLSDLSIKSSLHMTGKAGISIYDMILEVDASRLKIKEGYQARLKPLAERDKKAILIKPGIVNVVSSFNGYTEAQLSPFIQWEVWRDGQIIKLFLIKIEINLPASRLNKIFSSIINSRVKFLKYLAFILTGSDANIIGDFNKEKKDKNHDSQNSASEWVMVGVPVFESLLIAASRNPGRLKSVEKLIERLQAESIDNQEKIISNEFLELWKVFQSYLEQKKDEK